jgi:hypothetical protein
LVNLQYLDVSNNELDSLDGFGSLIHLRELKADGNNIRNIDGILDLNGLLTLKLSNNSLGAIDFGTCNANYCFSLSEQDSLARIRPESQPAGIRSATRLPPIFGKA